MPAIGSLGAYLRARRIRLDAAALGYGGPRRRTPGLRREEVAQRAGISATWYSWLEQGRGGAPSAQALERLARALMLTEAEREHLFLLGLGRPPATRSRPADGETAWMQRVLDGLDASPALIRSASWDVVAWNRAAAIVLADFAAMAVPERNLLRLLFLDPRMRLVNDDWEEIAPVIVGVFRADVARAGAGAMVQTLVDELCARSPEFATLWRASEVSASCDGARRLRRLRHPVLGKIVLEFGAFAVNGRPDLAMLVYTPISAGIAGEIRTLAGPAVARPAAARNGGRAC
jgi:transcriptional regulator with XRE-family HTH domain